MNELKVSPVLVVSRLTFRLRGDLVELRNFCRFEKHCHIMNYRHALAYREICSTVLNWSFSPLGVYFKGEQLNFPLASNFY